MTVEQLVHRRVRAWVPLLVNLVEQANPGLLGKCRCLRSGRDDLDQVVAPARDGVGPRVDPHAIGPAGQLVDGAPLAAPTWASARHGDTIHVARVTIRVTSIASGSRQPGRCW